MGAQQSNADNDGQSNSEPESNHPDNKKLTGTQWVSLKEQKRGCTDCICLVSIKSLYKRFALTLFLFSCY
jgi:hypothetical protein